MSTFIPCRFCGSKKGPMPGYYFDKVDRMEVIVECSCHVDYRRTKDIERRCKEASVWNTEYNPLDEYKGAQSLEDMKALTVVEKDPDRFKQAMIYMYGPNGTQKTTLAMWLARRLIMKGYSVKYTLMETLVNNLTPDFATDSSERDLFVDKALNCDFLFIDESFDKKKMNLYKSGYQIPFIDKFVRERYDINKRATFFISNVPSSNISVEGFGDNLQNLIERNVKQSRLSFLDVYITEANKFNPRGLFI